MHPESVSKIHDELDRVNPDPSEPFNEDMLAQLVYLQQAIDESQRLNPSVPLGVSRIANHDFEYEGYQIQKGVRVQLPFTTISRDERYISEPDTFNPDRWAEDSPELEVLQKMSIPYSIGNRVCIAANLARLKLRHSISYLMKHFEFEYTEPKKVSIDFHLHQGIKDDWVRIKRRTPRA
jgi:cytochrome P450